MNLRSVAYVRFLIIFIKIVVESEDTVCSHNMNFENLINRLYSSREMYVRSYNLTGHHSSTSEERATRYPKTNMYGKTTVCFGNLVIRWWSISRA